MTLLLIASLSASLNLAATPAPAAPATAVSLSTESQPFSETWLRDRAQQMAQADYAPLTGKLPPALTDLTYDQYRDIRFRPDASLWRSAKLPFQLQLFHLGLFFTDPVSLHVVERGRARTMRYTSNLFNYGKTRFSEPLPDTLGFAGFRIHYPLNRKDYFDELMVFLGASYFRALGRNNLYGLSARGLAIDTAEPTGEIFPVFREFYVEKPAKGAKGAKHLVVHALLDSPPMTGAYRFDIIPGDNIEVRVTTTLFPRRSVQRLGVAPLTSMFLFGENGRRGFDDYRPEVHDSDGLLIWFGNGEQLWRPLQNSDRLEVSEFRAEGLKGFGLLQRDRNQSHYEDLEASYERRPSVWIEPREGFGKGSVFLVEIPSREEIHDNIVAFYTPEAKPAPGTPIRLAYRMYWGMKTGPRPFVGSTVGTRTGSARQVGLAANQQKVDASARKFVVDFASPVPVTSADDVEAVVSASSGEAKNTRVESYPAIGGYRAVFDFVPNGANPVELRCFLRRGDTALSETWSYRFTPQREGGK